VAQVTLGVVVAALSFLLLVGCSGSEGSSSAGPDRATTAANDQPTGAPTDGGTPLADVDTTALVVPRAPFCDLVDPTAVTRALGQEAADVVEHRSGQRIRISDDVADVVHEFGCRWTAGDDTAEAWVFAPPVTRARAARLVRDARSAHGCADASSDASAFGRPSAACLSRGHDAATMTFQGLYGDAWLSCALTLTETPDREVTDRAARWCAAVATGAASAG